MEPGSNKYKLALNFSMKKFIFNSFLHVPTIASKTVLVAEEALWQMLLTEQIEWLIVASDPD